VNSPLPYSPPHKVWGRGLGRGGNFSPPTYKVRRKKSEKTFPLSPAQSAGERVRERGEFSAPTYKVRRKKSEKTFPLSPAQSLGERVRERGIK